MKPDTVSLLHSPVAYEPLQLIAGINLNGKVHKMLVSTRGELFPVQDSDYHGTKSNKNKSELRMKIIGILSGKYDN